MHSRKRRTEDLRNYCALVGPGDGKDPRDEAWRRARGPMKPDRKIRQLCKQVAQTLQLALGSLPEVEVMTGVYVHEVMPAPDAGRLCVVLNVANASDRDAVEVVVSRHAGTLRAEVAQAISRRRVPELTYLVVAEGGAYGA